MDVIYICNIFPVILCSANLLLMFGPTAMGYDESQYSLPRWMDLSVSRQGLFDDTFLKTPTEGWMFLPLDQYHGGGDAAKFEPLKDNSKVCNKSSI